MSNARALPTVNLTVYFSLSIDCRSNPYEDVDFELLTAVLTEHVNGLIKANNINNLDVVELVESQVQIDDYIENSAIGQFNIQTDLRKATNFVEVYDQIEPVYFEMKDAK